MTLHGARTMTKRTVVLSDGLSCVISIGSAMRNYYPDLPHCGVCDQAQREVQLFTCDAEMRGKREGVCGAYVCAAHRVRRGPYDYCPLHKEQGYAAD